MKKIVYLFLLICFSLSSKAQCVLDTFYITGISCYQDTGFIDVVYDSSAFSYEWYSSLDTFFTSVISTDEDLESATCGAFNVVVYDINGMPCDTSPPLFLGCPLGITPSHKNIKCFGDSTGELKRKGHSGTPPYSYQWFKDGVSFSSGPDDTLHSNLLVGQYKVIVTDSIGCKDSITSTIFSPPALVFDSLLIDNIDCNGNSTVLEIMVKGGRKQTSGKQYSYYLIQNNDTIAYSDTSGQSIGFSSTSPDTSYLDTVYFSNIFASTDSLIISVVDSFGCTTDTSIFIAEPDSIVAQIYLNTYPICSYDSTWIYLDSISGGVAPYSYQWTDGTSSDSIYVAGGFNRVFVTDANGCLDSTNGMNVITPSEIVVNASIIDVNCYGDSTGQIILQTSGGTGPIITDWGFGVDPLALIAGTYPVFINDSLGCLYPNTTFTITENPIINLSITKKNPTCLNHSNGFIEVDISGGISPYAVLWDNGNTNDSIFGLQVGMYIVEVSDSLGCRMTDTVELQSTDSLIIAFTNYTTNLSCYGEFTAIIANISGGITATGNYSISWDNGSTSTQTIIGGGIHQIIVRDDVGCEDTATIFIASPDPLVVDTNAINPTCLGNDGTIDVVVTGGTLPYQIQWSTGATGISISGLTAGNYWVIVIDSCGIKDSLGIVLDPYLSTLDIDNASLTHPSCADNDGEIDITVSGGFPPYSYSWSPGGQITNPITGLGFGNYTVLVTDDCGLETTGTYTLNQMTNTISASGFYDYLSLWSSISVSGSNPPFTINWTSITMTGDSIQGLCEGNYPIIVTDSENCEDTFSIDVFYNINQLVDASTSTVIDTSWGMGPFTYLWSNGQTTTHADSLCEGIHLVTVTANGGPFACQYTEEFEIDLQLELDPALTIVDCEDEFDGIVIIKVINNLHNIPYSFLWSTGDTTEKIEDNLYPGTYSVSVRYNNGCSIDTAIIIVALGTDCIFNVFSPNGDGDNDVWELEDSFLYADSEIKIYGRFGKKIFESNGYETSWDGTNEKGRAVPDGVYFYIINLMNGHDPIKGTVTIIR